eukprot:GHVL01036901.1.p1 GENE.GHVL01036901.1~~GHVL01036901.1.p1  ORF type:complete len:124 (-),score=4.61 GHVL01036901.1:1161-1532(-)
MQTQCGGNKDSLQTSYPCTSTDLCTSINTASMSDRNLKEKTTKRKCTSTRSTTRLNVKQKCNTICDNDGSTTRLKDSIDRTLTHNYDNLCQTFLNRKICLCSTVTKTWKIFLKLYRNVTLAYL